MLSAVVLLFSALLCKAQTVSPKHPCTQLLNFSAPGVEFSKAESIPAGDALPAYCLVQGMINKRTGAGGKQFGIGFELRLPDAWTKRFLFQGGGGMDGVVRPATGAIPISGSTAMPALARGFAVATTDSGHQGQGGPIGAAADSSFGIDQQARMDQAYGGFMAVTELARQMTPATMASLGEVLFYGLFQWRAASPFGCAAFSAGFDGVMSVAPAARVGTATISSVLETNRVLRNRPQGLCGAGDSIQGIF